MGPHPDVVASVTVFVLAALALSAVAVAAVVTIRPASNSRLSGTERMKVLNPGLPLCAHVHNMDAQVRRWVAVVLVQVDASLADLSTAVMRVTDEVYAADLRGIGRISGK